MNRHACLESWSRSLDMRSLRLLFPSPTYLLSEQQLRSNFDAWVDIVGAASNVCYPVKANPSLTILELLAGWGAQAECASAIEVRLARLAGFPSGRILYGTPAPDLNVARELLRQGSTVVVDSLEFLQALDDHAELDAGMQSQGRIFLRVNPSQPMGYLDQKEWQSLTSHAEHTGKFGIPSEQVVEAIDRCRSIRVTGLHTHVGTQMDHVASHAAALEILTRLADEIHLKTRHRIRIIDLGGGLGIPFTKNDLFPSVEALGEAIRPQFRAGMDYWVEPGHALIGNAVGLLAGIVAKKKVRGRDWAIADVGTDQLAKVTLLKWWHQILGPDGIPLPMEGEGALGGPLCFSGDILLPNTDVSALSVGDPVFIQHTGAYCAALGNTFNGRCFGGMALLKPDGKIVAAATTERESAQTPLSTHLWGASKTEWEKPQPVDIDRIECLSSPALKSGMNEDRYEFAQVLRTGQSSFFFDIDIGSSIAFVTMPLLVRIAGDASIISSLLALEQEEKRFPIWGLNLRLDMPANLPCDKRIRLRIDLSAVANTRTENEKRVLVRFSVVGTAVAGSFDLRFETPQPSVHSQASDASAAPRPSPALHAAPRHEPG